MPICCIVLLKAEEEPSVPSLFKIGGYTVYFWSNENNEPIHVHVCRESRRRVPYG